MFISTSKQKSKTKILLILIKQNDIKSSTLNINIYKKQNNKCYFLPKGAASQGISLGEMANLNDLKRDLILS